MNRNALAPTILICAIIAAAAVLVIVLRLHSDGGPAAPSSPATVTVTAPASTPVSTPVSTAPLSDFTVCITPVVTCNGEMKTQPAQIILSGDGSSFVSGLRWTGWGADGATGSGTLKLDNCTPNCAQGKLTPYEATITLSDLTPYGSGTQGYATMTVSAPGSPYGTHSYSHLLP